jgi:hypothetical protein
MDYVFFVFSALCLGFCVLLLCMIQSGADRVPRWWQVLLAVLVVMAYYMLEVQIFRKQLDLYFWSNLLPQALLFLVVVAYIWRGSIQNVS